MEDSVTNPLWQLIFSGILGLTYVLAGYRTMRFTARMTSALLFMGLGALVGAHVQNTAGVLAILAGSAVVGFLLGNAFYYVNIALFGAGAGVVVAAVIGASCGSTLGWGSGIGGGVAGAVLAILFERPIGIFGTSVIGAALTMMAVQIPLVLIGVPGPRQPAWSSVALFTGLTLLGCVVQARTTKNLPKRSASGKTPGLQR
jgi:hypothetical protein